MKKGTTGRTPGMDIFPSVEFAMAAFAGGIVLCTIEDPFGPTIGWNLKSHQGPKQVSLCSNKLLSISPGTPHHATKMPKKEDRHLSVWMPAVPTGLSS